MEAPPAKGTPMDALAPEFAPPAPLPLTYPLRSELAAFLTRLAIEAAWLAWQVDQALEDTERPLPAGRPRYALAA